MIKSSTEQTKHIHQGDEENRKFLNTPKHGLKLCSKRKAITIQQPTDDFFLFYSSSPCKWMQVENNCTKPYGKNLEIVRNKETKKTKSVSSTKENENEADDERVKKILRQHQKQLTHIHTYKAKNVYIYSLILDR